MRGVGVPDREFEFEFEVDTTPESKGEFLSEFEEFKRFTCERTPEKVSTSPVLGKRLRRRNVQTDGGGGISFSFN